MNREGKIALVGGKMTFAEAEDNEIAFWADKTWEDRLREMERLRKMIWGHLLGSYPDKIEKVGSFIKYSTLEEE